MRVINTVISKLKFIKMKKKDLKIFDLTKQYKSISKELNSTIIKVLKSGQYILGKNVSNFEKKFAKMFKSKIRMLPTRPGERLSSSNPTNKSFTDLGYKARISIKDYITDFISKKIN